MCLNGYPYLVQRNVCVYISVSLYGGQMFGIMNVEMEGFTYSW